MSIIVSGVMPKFEHLRCPFCDYESGDWNTCPRCEAPRMKVGRWLSKKWDVPVAEDRGSAMYHRDGTYWTNLSKFPGALFDPSGYILFNDEDSYLNCKDLRISVQTNTVAGLKLPEIEGYVVGNPPLKRAFDFEEITGKAPKKEDGYIYALQNPAWPEYVKIGKSVEPNQRIESYQTYSPHRDYKPICNHVYSKNYGELEKMAHAIARQLSGDFNAKEWFKLSPQQAEKILLLVANNDSL